MNIFKNWRFYVLIVLGFGGFWLFANEYEVSTSFRIVEFVCGCILWAGAYFLAEGWMRNGDLHFPDEEDFE